MYMLILILFYFVAQVLIANVSPPPPLSQPLSILILLSPALPRPFPTPSFGGAAHVCVVKLAAIWRSSRQVSLISSPILQYL